MKGYCGIVDGGLNIDGFEEVFVKEVQVVEECVKICVFGFKVVVIVGVFLFIDEIF